MKLPSLTTRSRVGFLMFFCVIAAFWTLKPLKTSAVVKSFGAEYYPLFKEVSVLFIPFVLLIYSKACILASRRRLINAFVAVFVFMSVVFWALLQWRDVPWTQGLFFFYVDIYISVMVTLFWTYVNDHSTVASAKASYGFIGAGGLAGGIAGSAISGWAVPVVGTHVVLISALFLLPIVWAVNLLEDKIDTPAGPVVKTVSDRNEPKKTQAAASGFQIVLRSRYLLAILGVVAFYEIASTLIDFEFNLLLKDAFPTKEAMAGFQGKVFFGAQLAALLIQLILTPFVHQKFGVLAGLVLLPVVLLVGSVAFVFEPVLFVITAVIGVEAAFAYSLNQSSKEILYIPLDREAKYKAMAFIDMFVFRAAKGVGAAIVLLYSLLLFSMGVPLKIFAAMNVVVILLWLFSALNVGNQFGQLRYKPKIADPEQNLGRRAA